MLNVIPAGAVLRRFTIINGENQTLFVTEPFPNRSDLLQGSHMQRPRDLSPWPTHGQGFLVSFNSKYADFSENSGRDVV